MEAKQPTKKVSFINPAWLSAPIEETWAGDARLLAILRNPYPRRFLTVADAEAARAVPPFIEQEVPCGS